MGQVESSILIRWVVVHGRS